MIARFLIITLIASVSLVAEDAKSSEIPKISEAFGHLLGKNFKTLGVDLDMELVFKGIKDQANGKPSPMTDEDCLLAISTAKQAHFLELAQNNLQSAENFLQENAKKNEIIVLEEGKLQYKVEKKGEGAKVEPNFSPLIRYIGKYMDGSVFGQSQEAEVLPLNGTIPGFSKGLVGMQEGEKRTLYIHPEMAYGTKGALPPNSLLTFEVEIVKANTVEEELSNSLIIESEAESKATADLNAPVIR